LTALTAGQRIEEVTTAMAYTTVDVIACGLNHDDVDLYSRALRS
jgi:hypothetical protein